MAFDPDQTSDAYLPGEAKYATDFAARGNLAGAERLRNLNLDDNPNTQTPNNIAKSPATVNIYDTNVSGQKTGKSLVDQNFPGSRLDNPLSAYSSYTYSLTLYMVTPEFMNEFLTGEAAGTIPANRINSNQIFVVAQSAGVNNNVDSRAITFSKKLGKNQQGLDYFIDDLTFAMAMPGANGQTQVSQVTFKITEPNGFSFIEDLNTASEALNRISPMAKSTSERPIAVKQNYIISVRYYGYDITGKVVQSIEEQSKFSDPLAATESHFGILIADIKFKLDEKSTIYSITTVNASEQASLSKSNGLVEQQTTVSGSTIQDALVGGTGGSVGLLQIINSVNRDKKDKNKMIDIPNEYTIEFIGKDNPIPKSKLIDDKAFESRISKMSPVSRTEASTISASFKSVTVNTTARNLSISAGTPIVQAIDNIIVKSDFVSAALNKVNTGNPETKTVNNSSIKPLQWYSINPVATIKGFDPKTNRWAYKINYQIGIYNIPFIRTPYAGKKVKYPGPYKYYGYFLTGENTEILEYEQIYNGLYSVTVGRTTSESKITDTDVKNTGASIVSQPSNSAVVGGKLGRGSEVNESVSASLSSTTQQGAARIKILGDPDYLMTVVGTNQNIGNRGSNSVGKLLYGPNKSINPFNGQVFIQIMFNMTSDYQSNGVMDINDKIQFYETKKVSNAGIKGVVYLVNYVESSFSKGSFTQVLDCSIAPENMLLIEDSKNTQERITPETTGITAGTAGGTTNIGIVRSTSPTQKYDIRAPLYSSDEEADRAAEQSNYTLEPDVYGGLAPTLAQTANDDKVEVVNREIRNTGLSEGTAREIFGNESVNTFGTTAGGAAFGNNRNASRRQRLSNQRL